MFSRKSVKKVNFSISPRVKRKRNYSQKGKTNVKFINSNKNNDNAEKIMENKIEEYMEMEDEFEEMKVK